VHFNPTFVEVISLARFMHDDGAVRVRARLPARTHEYAAASNYAFIFIVYKTKMKNTIEK